MPSRVGTTLFKFPRLLSPAFSHWNIPSSDLLLTSPPPKVTVSPWSPWFGGSFTGAEQAVWAKGQHMVLHASQIYPYDHRQTSALCGHKAMNIPCMGDAEHTQTLCNWNGFFVLGLESAVTRVCCTRWERGRIVLGSHVVLKGSNGGRHVLAVHFCMRCAFLSVLLECCRFCLYFGICNLLVLASAYLHCKNNTLAVNHACGIIRH